MATGTSSNRSSLYERLNAKVKSAYGKPSGKQRVSMTNEIWRSCFESYTGRIGFDEGKYDAAIKQLDAKINNDTKQSSLKNASTMAFEAKRNLSQLWGHDNTDIIDEKLSELRMILNDSVHELALLDYLQTFDLDVERCVDAHFNPPLPATDAAHDTNHNHNHNAKLHKSPLSTSSHASEHNNQEDDHDVSLQRKRQLDENKDQAGDINDGVSQPVLKRRKLSNNHNNNTNTNATAPIATTTNIQLKQERDDGDDDDANDDGAAGAADKTMNDVNSDFKESDGVAQPVLKRRKLSNNHNNNNITAAIATTTTTTNSNILLKQERDDEDDDGAAGATDKTMNDANSDFKESEENLGTTATSSHIAPPLPPKAADNWETLHLGSFTLEYKVQERTVLLGPTSLQSTHHSGDSLEVMTEHSAPDMQHLYDEALEELENFHFRDAQGLLKLDGKSTVLEEPSTSNNATEDLLTSARPFENGEGMCSMQMQFIRRGTYQTTFSLRLQRKVPKLDIARPSAEVDIRDLKLTACLSLLTDNKAFHDEEKANQKMKDEFIESYNHGHSHSVGISMPGLLDFCCRTQYTVSDQQRSEEQNNRYGLNVRLYDYQFQTIQHMMDEENDPVGFYRHFYRQGHFQFDGDDKKETSAAAAARGQGSFFYYSSIFRHLMVNQQLPIAHGGFIAEEMGLGKTIECLAVINANRAKASECSTPKNLKIAHIESRLTTVNKWNEDTQQNDVTKVVQSHACYKSRATLVIAPVSLVGQWEKECVDRSRVTLACKRYYGWSRNRDVGAYIDQDIVFTTYGILGVENGDNPKKHVLHCIEWHRIVLDESHSISNRNTKCAQNTNKLRARNKWLLTGTLFGRQLYDIDNQLEFIGLQATHRNFLALKDLAKHTSRSQANCLRLPAFLKVMQCMVMRHKKAQQFNGANIVDMPEKVEDVIVVEWQGQQKEYYDKLYGTARERYEMYKATGNLGRGTIALLAALAPARQACSGHVYSRQEIELELSRAQTVAHRVQNLVNSNLERSAQELYEMAMQEAFNMDEEECAICYETPLDEPLQTACRHVFCGECILGVLSQKPECPMCRQQCTPTQLKKPPSKNADKDAAGNDEAAQSQESVIKFDAKIKLVVEKIKTLCQEKPADKSLIFTSFSKSLNWICSELSNNDIEYRTLSGDMSMNKRKKALEEFASNDNVRVFVLTVRSGAVGITLTAANHVFMMEPPFNPALYKQAINRVYRLGQHKKVYCHTLIMRNSIEQRIWHVNKDKQSDDSKNNHVAGNLNTDRKCKLQQHEISKLFEVEER